MLWWVPALCYLSTIWMGSILLLPGAPSCFHHCGWGLRFEVEPKPSCKEAHATTALEHSCYLNRMANEMEPQWYDAPKTGCACFKPDWSGHWQGFCTQECCLTWLHASILILAKDGLGSKIQHPFRSGLQYAVLSRVHLGFQVITYRVWDVHFIAMCGNQVRSEVIPK